MKKMVVQGLIYLIEVLLAVALFSTIHSKLIQEEYFKWVDEILTPSYITYAAFYFVLYQLLIYAVITLSNSAKNDSNIVLHNLVNYVYVQVKFARPIDSALFRINKFLIKEKGKYMFSKKDILFMDRLENILIKYRINEITEYELIYYLEHSLLELNFDKEYNNATWKNSILLNLIKDKTL